MFAVSVTMLASSMAWAQYPERPIKMIVPFPPGGVTDTVARPVADALSKALGQSVVVENKAGAGGAIGTGEAAHAKPDGYTILLMLSSISILPEADKILGRKAAYNTTDFKPIARITADPTVLVVSTKSPWKTIDEFVAAARQAPGKLDYGSSGIYGSMHVPMAMLENAAGIKLTHVPFKGNADNMQAILGGHVMGASDATGWGPHVESGKLRLLATYGSKRTKRWPNVPTLTELGYDTVSDSPFGVCGPKGMDPAVVATLHEAFRRTLNDPAVLATFDKYDQSVIYMNTSQYTRFARETFVAEKATIERLGMSRKS